MFIVTNPNILVERPAHSTCLAVINAKEFAIFLDSVSKIKKNCLKTVVERDATNQDSLAAIDVRLRVILVKSALKFHVMLK